MRRRSTVTLAVGMLLGGCGPARDEGLARHAAAPRTGEATSAAAPTTAHCPPERYLPADCSSPDLREQDAMVQLARMVPGFGGFYGHGAPQVPGQVRAPAPFQYTAWLKDLSQSPLAARRISAKFDVPEAAIGFVQGTWDMLELARFECQVRDAVGPWTSSDLDEGRNRVVIGLATEGARQCAASRLQLLQRDGELQDVPLDAVLLEVRGEVEPADG